MKSLKLFMLLLGCKPKRRNTEQHDVFFGIGYELNDLQQDIFDFWPEANKKIHLDAWREVRYVDQYRISIIPGAEKKPAKGNPRLFFLNLGGYKPDDFEEYHYKIIVAGKNKSEAIMRAKETAFYRHTGFKGAASHIDDKYGLDVDNIYEISDILPPSVKEKFSIVLDPAKEQAEDELHVGYLKLGTTGTS